MTVSPAVAPTPGGANCFIASLGRPWVDRVIAVVAALPFGYILWKDILGGRLTLPRFAIIFQLTLFIVTMLIRTPPVRVTTNPVFWIVTFVASYYGFLTASLTAVGRPLVPSVVTDTLSIASVSLDAFARVSLGRNIGFVPAQRRLVTAGAYRFVRHPIYSALFLAEVSVALEGFSWVNLGLSAIFVALFVVKTLMEESFLRRDPVYARYLTEVRFRWIPGLL